MRGARAPAQRQEEGARAGDTGGAQQAQPPGAHKESSTGTGWRQGGRQGGSRVRNERGRGTSREAPLGPAEEQQRGAAQRATAEARAEGSRGAQQARPQGRQERIRAQGAHWGSRGGAQRAQPPGRHKEGQQPKVRPPGGRGSRDRAAQPPDTPAYYQSPRKLAAIVRQAPGHL